MEMFKVPRSRGAAKVKAKAAKIGNKANILQPFLILYFPDWQNETFN